MTRRPTAAQRARARQDAALAAPPPRIRPRASTLEGLTITAAGRRWLIGPAVEGDTPWEMTTDGAATLTITVRSPDERLLELIGNAGLVARDGVTVDVDGITYALRDVGSDDKGLYTLVLEDVVAWRLRQFSSYLSATRATTTRAGFVRRFITEAGAAPREPIRAFIPEARDRQPVAAAQEP